MAKKDDELIVMGRLWRTLDAQTADARERIMCYLMARHEEKIKVESSGEPVNFPVEK
jgi:hypothetical protein